MLHCLAFGNSDQASFRDEVVRACFDILTIPSTIASYYPDATAAFVLSSGLDYMIEPRTPLFQELLQSPRASHYTLADIMGNAVSTHLGSADSRWPNAPIDFPVSFYSLDVCDEVVGSMIEFQRGYGTRAAAVKDKLDRYNRLLELATGDASLAKKIDERRSPRFILCPYFAVVSLYDEWWGVMERVWDAASRLDNSRDILPVVAVSDVFRLREALEEVPDGLSSRRFFWIPGFNERHVEVTRLCALRDVVREMSTRYELMNLYGGYFSILLGQFGLSGFNNGLGYSESRQWPTLDATGAAPPRYYVPRLHAFLPTATARVLLEADRGFRCVCPVCSESSKLPTELSYHELKRHFALARAWELRKAEKSSLSDLCSAMRDDAARLRRTRLSLPTQMRIPFAHLENWANALDE